MVESENLKMLINENSLLLLGSNWDGLGNTRWALVLVLGKTALGNHWNFRVAKMIEQSARLF